MDCCYLSVPCSSRGQPEGALKGALITWLPLSLKQNYLSPEMLCWWEMSLFESHQQPGGMAGELMCIRAQAGWWEPLLGAVWTGSAEPKAGVELLMAETWPGWDAAGRDTGCWCAQWLTASFRSGDVCLGQVCGVSAVSVPFSRNCRPFSLMMEVL